MYVAQALDVGERDRRMLEGMLRQRNVSVGRVFRARIVLLAAAGMANTDIAEELATSRMTVIKWRRRYAEAGIAGLSDAPRSGKPAVIDEVGVLARTFADDGRPPAYLGLSHWSTRLLGAELGISFAQVGRIWRKWNVQPHRVETFKHSTDPKLEEKIRDVVGLYTDPPAGAVVISVDEKTQIQALDRTSPILPLRPGLPARQTHDYIRHGTSSLFAALETQTGKIAANACYQRHTNIEFLDFLQRVAAAHRDDELHIICDNYSTHKHANVKAWLAANPRITMHFTPTSCSWLNMVEIFFGIITRQAIRRGTFASVEDLEDTIDRYIDNYNETARPFQWVTTADDILTKTKRKRNNDTLH